MTTIRYDKPVRDFIAGLNKTGHVTHVKYKKTSITFHHNGGRLSLQGILDVWKTRPASAHFQSDQAGAIGQYVHVNEFAWATGNTTGNQKSISIEMANSTLAPKWQVAEVTWKSAARLAGWLFANEIDGKPRPSKNNVFFHKHWKSTDCAGPYMDTQYNNLLAEVQKWYDHFTGKTPPSSGGEISMAAEQNILKYMEAVSLQLQRNNRQVTNNAVNAICDFVRKMDAEDDLQDDARFAKMKAEMLAALEAEHDATLEGLPSPTAVPSVLEQ